MSYSAAVVDTNVVVAGLLTRDVTSPTSRILDGMRSGAFPFLLSTSLIAEYREVLLRPRIRARHRLAARDVDRLLTEIVTHGIVRDPDPGAIAPDRKDSHLWDLLATQPESILVTGDLPLRRHPLQNHAVVSPREFLQLK